MFHELRYGLRKICKSPGFSLVSVGILALGIGANSILFTFVNAYILRPLPFASPERNVEIRARDSANRARAFWSYPEFLRLVNGNGVLEAAYGYAHFEVPYREAGRTLKGVAVTGNLFSLLRARPTLGRFFGPEEDSVPSRDAVLVISESAWRRVFNADPAIVGRSIRIRQRPFTIVGVAEAGFTGLDPITPDCWAPLAMYAQLSPEPGRIADPERLWVIAAGLLKPAISLPHAAQALSSVAAALTEGLPPALAIAKVELTPRRAFVVLTPSVVIVALLISAAFGLVLLIACANLAGLMLARAVGREREIAIRLALGASSGAIARQFLVESVLLALMAAGPALALTWCGIRPVQELLFTVLVRQGFSVRPIQPDWAVFGFTLVVAAGAGILFGLPPALQARAVRIAERIRQQGAGAGIRSPRVREALVIGQLATSLMLLLLAAFFVRSVQRINRVEPGFDIDRVLDVRPDGGRDKIVARLRQDPRFLLVSEVYRAPLYGLTSRMSAEVAGRAFQVPYNYVDQHYFATLGISVLRGRNFHRADCVPESRAAIVSEAAARLLWPGQDALGKTFQATARLGNQRYAEGRYEVAGIVADAASSDVTAGTDRTAVYLPAVPGDARNTGLVVRTAANAATAVPYVRQLCAGLDEDSFCRPVPLSDLAALQRSPYAIAGGVASALGGLAVVLSSIGLYGVVAYSVVQRRREIGIRMALGASRARILRLVLRECGRRLAWGLAFGIPGCLVAAKLAKASFLTLETGDPAAFVVAPAALAAVSALACCLPASRAAAIDPSVLLRET